MYNEWLFFGTSKTHSRELFASLRRIWSNLWRGVDSVKSAPVQLVRRGKLASGGFPALLDRHQLERRGEDFGVLGMAGNCGNGWLESLGALFLSLVTLAGGQQCSVDHQREAFALQTLHR